MQKIDNFTWFCGPLEQFSKRNSYSIETGTVTSSAEFLNLTQIDESDECFGQYGGILSESLEEMTYRVGLKDVNRTFMFIVAGQKGDRQQETVVIVEVAEGEPPGLSIRSVFCDLFPPGIHWYPPYTNLWSLLLK